MSFTSSSPHQILTEKSEKNFLKFLKGEWKSNNSEIMLEHFGLLNGCLPQGNLFYQSLSDWDFFQSLTDLREGKHPIPDPCGLSVSPKGDRRQNLDTIPGIQNDSLLSHAHLTTTSLALLNNNRGSHLERTKEIKNSVGLEKPKNFYVQPMDMN